MRAPSNKIKEVCIHLMHSQSASSVASAFDLNFGQLLLPLFMLFKTFYSHSHFHFYMMEKFLFSFLASFSYSNFSAYVIYFHSIPVVILNHLEFLILKFVYMSFPG
jgi:hypothetical protein